MKQVYINSVGSISAQKTYDNSTFLNEVVDYNENVIPAINPNYKDFIPPAQARRMAKGIKMSIVASKIAMQEANLKDVDAIITGTGMGCLRDSEKFLANIMDNKEEYLTPTAFIQSTHNTVGGQIALDLQCKGYNFTYVHGSISFESALLDAKLQIENNEANNILIGGVDEIGDYTTSLHKAINHVKSENIKLSELLNSKSQGTIYSEGANFFVMSSQLQDSTYAEVVAIKTFNTLPQKEVSEAATEFLAKNHLTTNDIDVVVLGNNGDVGFDDYYNTLASNLFSNTSQVSYKNISGEFNTASSFGLWLALKIIKTQTIPDVVKLNNKPIASFKNILLYNQYRGENHSFTLLRKC